MVDGPIAIPLDVYKTSDFDEVKNLVTFLFGEILKDLKESGKRRPSDPQCFRQAITSIVLTLMAARYAHPDAYVFYSRKSNYYTGKPLAYRHVITITDSLYWLDYIEHETGSRKDSARSRIKACDSLVNLFQMHHVTPYMMSVHPSFARIRLKDGDKKLIPLPKRYREQRQVRKMKRRLLTIQRTIDRTFIGLQVSDDEMLELNERLMGTEERSAIDFSKNQLYRVFSNGSLTQGGRFYGGWWQSLPTEYRDQIVIHHPDGSFIERAAEIDFSSMQPALAYALIGKSLDENAYMIDAVASAPEHAQEGIREVVKQTLLTMLNVSSKSSVHRAVYSWLGNKHGRKRGGIDDLPSHCPTVGDIHAQLVAKHADIVGFFYSAAGNNLMYQDAQIAEEIMFRMARHGIAAFPIHDSFLVAESQTELLENTMKEAFFDKTNGAECRVAIEPQGEQDNVFDDEDATIFMELLSNWMYSNEHHPINAFRN